MAHIGKELALGPVGCFGRLFCLLQRPFRLLEFTDMPDNEPVKEQCRQDNEYETLNFRKTGYCRYVSCHQSQYAVGKKNPETAENGINGYYSRDIKII